MQISINFYDIYARYDRDKCTLVWFDCLLQMTFVEKGFPFLDEQEFQIFGFSHQINRI